ncbi:UNVERIFIED_ORG: hypothetical protein M2328_006689 [Rhodococcus erythropolis]
MGSDIYSSANFSVQDNDQGRAALAYAVGKLQDISALGLTPDGDEDAGAVIAGALAKVLGLAEDPNDFTEVWNALIGGRYIVSVSGEGVHSDPSEIDAVLSALAESDVNGEITCESDDYDRWRLRVVGGQVRKESGEIVYGDDALAAAWVVQMQGHDDNMFDQVAVVGSEAEATPILAEWAREAAKNLVDAGALGERAVDVTADDAIVLEQWADAGGVKWEVYQAGAQNH